MMVSEQLKIVYVDPPKTGSSTMDSIFKHMGCVHIKYRHREQNRWFPKHQRIVPEQYRDYKIIASVRNPYTRLLSLYHFDKKRRYNFANLKLGSFYSYVEGILSNTQNVPSTNQDIYKFRYFPQWKYLENIRVDELIHMESIQADLKKCDLVMRQHIEPKLNKGKYKYSWDEIKSPELIEMINEWAGPDFELYGYERL